MIATLKQNKKLYRRLRLTLLIIGCICLCWGSYETWSHFFSDTTINLRLSAGRTVTRRHQLAEHLRDTVKQTGIHLDLVSTAGSEEALAQVNSGALDAAIVSSGIMSTGKDNVRELAALQVEPAHLLIRKELAEKPGLLRDVLRGKRVNLDEPGSSAYALAQEIMAFTHLKPVGESGQGDFIAMTLGAGELIQRAQEIKKAGDEERLKLINDLPDALLLVVSMPSKVTQALIDHADYRVVPLPFVRAFISNSSQDEGKLNNIIDHSYIEQVIIPAGSYLGSKPMPAQDCETIGLRLLLVANKDVPARAVYRLMSGVFEGEFARRNKPISATEKDSPYDVHLGALAYENRNKPYLLNEVIDIGKKVMSAFGIFSAGALSFFALLRTKQYKSAGDYLNEIRQIDLIARGLVSDSQAPKESVALARHLDERLAKLKSELIQDCCNKKFKNEMMLLNILTILVDTRQQIMQLLPDATRQAEVQSEQQATLAFQGKRKKVA